MHYYILEGKEPKSADNFMEWAKWIEESSRRVAKTEVMGYEVSTVFLGLDHGYGDGPPALFETMIFGGEFDQECWRYETWEEAEAGHQRVVKALQDGIDPNLDTTPEM